MIKEIKLIENPYLRGMNILIEENIKLICSISKEPFTAKITITYEVNDKFIELVSLRNYIKKEFKEETIESLCYKIKNELSCKLHNNVKVCVTGESKIHPTETVWL